MKYSTTFRTTVSPSLRQTCAQEMSSDDDVADSSEHYSDGSCDNYDEEDIQPAAKKHKLAIKTTKSPPSAPGVFKDTNTSLEDNRPVEEIYQKKTQLEHILLRPDTYIGSIEHITQPMWVYDLATTSMVQRPLTFVPGFFKIFDEILVNAADNKIRDPHGMTVIKVDIDKENNRISIYNNGRGIPVELHAKEGVYVPELIFGHLLTSSNYDDDQKKVTGGRNGYGAKLCNIFSTEFVVETSDQRIGKKFKQVFTNNMSRKTAPSITNYSREDFTMIVFRPDLVKFGMAALDDDHDALLRKRVYDLAGCLNGVKVFLNGERIKTKGFKQYADLYLHRPALGETADLNPNPNPAAVVAHELVNERWEVCCTVSDGQFQQVSFVNSINTYKGGTHVNYVVDQVVAALVENIKKKHKGVTVKPFQVKNHLSIFLNCLIENPTFDSQTKENMTLRASAFGSKCELGEEFVRKVMKTGIMENVLAWAKFKQDQALKKTDGHKKSRLSGISKLEDANMAGTKQADKCTLILTEGDSAKALAVSGLAVVGRDYYGVFPLRGKLLNVREASHKQIMENQEINHVKQIMGLQHGKVYTSTESLRYGHLMIMTDQDHDGSHIKGLLINFLDHFWPSLMNIPGFLVEFITPIVKVTKGRQEISFYTIPEYETWKAAHDVGKGWTIKYYKGLGTSTSADAKKYFSDLPTHMKVFTVADAEDRSLVDMAFNKKKADDRKDWLKNFQPGVFMDHSVERIKISDFINRELILFSMADNVRSIPSMVDGMKPGHRKILFCCFKRKLRGEIKVAQLAGYVSEHSAYHHGEQSLCTTIIGLAQNYVGSNNINLLEPNGQFGTRIQGGKDAASPRYIFTSLTPFARLLYRSEDDALLKYLNDDGQSIEPEWYIPVLPMVLANGGEGIGTGWSTSIPTYNPAELVENLRRLMVGDPVKPLKPWYRGFAGEIEAIGADKFRISGIARQIDDQTIEITELPVGTWTQSYKEFLEGMLAGTEKTEPFIRDFREYHTDTTVHFVITLSRENMATALSEGLEKRFRLVSLIATSNLVCFDALGQLRKYPGPEKVLEDFYDLRLSYYQRRKEWMTASLEREWTKLDNKMRFVEEIIDGRLVVQKRKKSALVMDLKERGYQTFKKEEKDSVAAGQSEDLEEAEENENVLASGYDYLLSMPIYSLTFEKVQQLAKERAEKEAQLNHLLGQTPKDLWSLDLDAFMAEWNASELARLSVNANGFAGVKKKTGAAAKTKAKQAVGDEDIDTCHPRAPLKSSAKAAEKTALQPAVKRTRKTAKAASDSKTVVSSQEGRAAARPPAKPIQPAASTVDGESEDELSLPLAERIARVLSSKSAESMAIPARKKQVTLDSFAKVSSTLEAKTAATATTQAEYGVSAEAAPVSKTRRIVAIASDSDEDGPGDLESPAVSQSQQSQKAAKPSATIAAAESRLHANARVRAKKSYIESDASEDDESVFEMESD